MRLFTAIDLDEAARAAIAQEQAALRKALAGGSMKWVRPEQLHLTLVFIGHVPNERGPEFIAAMDRAIAQAPFRLVLGGTGLFPERGAPRVLWMGVREGAADALALQNEVASRLGSLGAPRESRPFAPHLTLARWREPRSSDRRRVPPDTGTAVAAIEVGAVTLFESRLSSSGPEYSVLARAVLQPC